MRLFSTPDQLDSAVGEELGVSAWRTVTAEMVSRFGDAVGGPGPVRADGYLMLGMIPRMMSEILAVAGTALILNKGVDRVRFGAPVHLGGRVRGRACVVSVRRRPRGFWEVLYHVRIEVDDEGAAAVVADTIFMYAAEATRTGPTPDGAPHSPRGPERSQRDAVPQLAAAPGGTS